MSVQNQPARKGNGVQLDADEMQVAERALASQVRAFPADLASAALLLRVRAELGIQPPEVQPWAGSRGPIVPGVPKGQGWPVLKASQETGGSVVEVAGQTATAPTEQEASKTEKEGK